MGSLFGSKGSMKRLMLLQSMQQQSIQQEADKTKNQRKKILLTEGKERGEEVGSVLAVNERKEHGVFGN